MPKSKIHMLDFNFFENKSKIFDIEWNPVKNNQFSISDFEGRLHIIEYNPNGSDGKFFREIKKFKPSAESIHCLNYSADGSKILSGSSIGELKIIQESKIIFNNDTIHKKQIDEVRFIKESLFCSTGSDGTINIWDLRQKGDPVFKFKEQVEEITDLETNRDTTYLLATSIDGTLGVYDIRKSSKYNLYALSDNIEDEIYSMKIVKNGLKVACGTSEGPVVLFDWDWFGDYKDRIIGHPGSVNTLEKFNEDYLISGSEDGQIRFISLYPNFIKSMIIDKSEKKLKNKIFSEINKISLNNDHNHVACLSNINYVKIYNISEIGRILEDNDENSDSESSGWQEEVIHLNNLATEKYFKNKSEEENEEIDENEEDSDDEEDEEIDIHEKEIDLNDNMQLETLLADEKFSDLLKSIKVEKVRIKKEKEERNSENGSQDYSDKQSSEDEDCSEKRKKKNGKTDRLLKFKALGKKRNSEWIIEKEKRKEFFCDL